MTAQKIKGPVYVVVAILAVTVPSSPASASDVQALLGPGVFQPAPVVMITYDNSLSMDWTAGDQSVPSYPPVCEPWAVEYSRTRHVVGVEALTGSYQGYCPVEVQRSETWPTRDDTITTWPHTQARFESQRRDGLLDVYGDLFYFGLATFDSMPDWRITASGDYSYGSRYGDINLGIANGLAPMGGLVSPLPAGWMPTTPGAVSAFRLHNNARIQETVRGIIPGLYTPIGSTMDDIQFLRHNDAGLRSDPFAACRNVVHVLVTDGEPYYDRCHGGGWTPSSMRCTEYRSAYSAAISETMNLADGTNCGTNCPDATRWGVETFVLAFQTDSANIAEDLAIAADTCAIWEEDEVTGTRTCTQHAFSADAHAGVLFSMGTILNRQLSGTLSLAPPLITTMTVDGEVGVVRFHAGAEVSQSSPYWSGEVVRQARVCQTRNVDGEDVRGLFPLEDLEFADGPEEPEQVFYDSRRIYTGRLDIAIDGASCVNPYCPIGSTGCAYHADAIPDPMLHPGGGYGDGSGGPDRGGHIPDALPVLGSPTCEGPEYDLCMEGCGANSPSCEVECELFFRCGAIGYTDGPPACVAEHLSSCADDCVVETLDSNGDNVVDGGDGATSATITAATDFCTCACEEFLGCGACADPRLVEVTPDVQFRWEVDDRLRARRRLAGIRGNDEPLPADLKDAVDYEGMETYPGSCLIEFEVETFGDGALAPALFAENVIESERTVRFVRGQNLTSMIADGLLGDVFDPLIVPFHDRDADDFMGDFYHSRMAMLGQPSPLDRSTAGWREFVEEHGLLAETPRPLSIFVGGNDGMLHAFDGDTGQELWGVIPPSFLPQLNQTVVSHRLTVDGPVAARDLRCGQRVEEGLVIEEWCSLVAVSYRGGGSGVMVLEVSDPKNPKFLFELTGQQLPELGMGYPMPLLGNIFIEGALQPVLVLSGGRPLGGPAMVIGDEIRGTHDGEMFLIMNALTGQIYEMFDPVSHPALFAECGPVTGSPAGWSRDRFSRLFAGTQNGCLLRVDVSQPDPDDWTLDVIYRAHGPGEITHPPAIATRADGSLVVVFGHGNSDSFEHVNQLSRLISVSEVREVVDADEGNDRLATLQLGVGEGNWEIKLEPGEFMTTPPVISDGVVYVATWGPNNENACALGEPRLYGVHFLGDPSVSGPDSTVPQEVTVDSERIIPMLTNPDHNPIDPESEAQVPFYGSELLGEGSVVSALSIVPVPSCERFITTVDGVTVEVPMGATERQLIIDVITRGDDGDEDEGESPGPEDGEGDDYGELGMVQIEHELPPPSVTSFLMDWGVGAEVW